jgi:hypothetical protein
MTTTNPEGWSAASAALDHHETVKALTAALPGWLTTQEATADTVAAETMAASLAREGLALIRLPEADRPLAAQAERAWFGTDGEDPR